MDSSILRKKVSEYCDTKGRGALNAVAKEIGVSRQNLYSWRAEKSNMGADKIVKLIRYLKVNGIIAPTDFLDMPSGIIPLVDVGIPDEDKCYELLKFIRKQVRDEDAQTEITKKLLGILNSTEEIMNQVHALRQECDSLQIDLQQAAED